MPVKFPMINQKVEDLGIKQKVMAERIGLPTSTVSERLRGKSDWTLEEGVKISKWLNVPLDELTRTEVTR